MRRILLVSLLATLSVSACAPLASVREVDARLGAQHGNAPQLQRAEQAIAEAKILQHSEPQRAIGLYLTAAEASGAALRNNPRDALAERDYNFALARVFSVMRDCAARSVDASAQGAGARWRRILCRPSPIC